MCALLVNRKISRNNEQLIKAIVKNYKGGRKKLTSYIMLRMFTF